MQIKHNHEQAINKIINDHFHQAEKRLENVYQLHFISPKAIFSRHWRHKKDIPSDLLALPRHTWNFISVKILKKDSKSIPQSGKVKEIEKIVYDELLDLKWLENKIQSYVEPYQLNFETEFTNILKNVPGLQQNKFLKELEDQLEKLTTPIEGTRETVMFLIAGIIGKVFSDKVTFGSAIATGQAAATSIYMSQLTWVGSLWAGIFGAPMWVTVIGASGGILIGAIVAPLLTPIFELGFNKLRAKKILKETIVSAQHKMIEQDPDAYNVAGKIAIYLQVFPDILHLAKKTAKLVVS